LPSLSSPFWVRPLPLPLPSDVKWINQYVNDDKGGAAADVVLKYCTCMNNKMSDNETQSITQ
jgi:hypothetical protein